MEKRLLQIKKMKRLILILVSFSAFSKPSFTQETYVPDDNFEQELINLGYDNVLDDSVTTANITGITSINLDNLEITDLTGIQDFLTLEVLMCASNFLTSIDLTQNVSLEYVDCSFNDLQILDLTQNLSLTSFDCKNNQITSLELPTTSGMLGFNCQNNQITSLDLSSYANMYSLFCSNNQLSTLDLTQNIAIGTFYGNGNPLTCLNMKSGNNSNVVNFIAYNCPLLTCIEVDDVALSTANWTQIDTQTSYSTNCSNSCTASIEEFDNPPKQLTKIVDLMGRDTFYKSNTYQIYRYSDGTTESVFRIEN